MKVADIKLRGPYSRGPAEEKELTHVLGFDTETLKSGYVFLLADSEGNHIWIRELKDLLPFITSGEKYVCYNMRFDAEALLKWFGKDFCSELLKGKKPYHEDLGVRVWYAPGKFLHFIKGSVYTTFWDVAQFYQEQGHYVPLKQAASVHLGKEKLEFPVQDMGKSFYDNQQLLEYCINDAKLAGDLGNLLIKEYREMGIIISGLVSPANIMESFVLDYNRTWIPDITKIPLDVLQYAEDAVLPPWREFFKRGYFPTMYNYDINSAFPFFICRLIDICDGEWKYLKRTILHEAFCGYVKCIVEVPETYVSWVGYMNKIDDNFTPFGKFPVTLTLNGLRNLPEGTKVKVIDGWYFIPWEIRAVFRDAFEDLFKIKEKSDEGSLRRHLVKVLIASLHGKFRQTLYDGDADETRMGRLFMPPYAAEIMTNARLHIYEVVRQIPPEFLIGIHTDCIYSSEELEMKLGRRAGGWDLRGTYPFLVIGLNHAEKGEGWFTNQIRLNPEATEYMDYRTPRNAPVSLGEAIEGDEFEKAGVFERYERKVDIVHQVYKRFWPNTPLCGGDLLNNTYDSKMLNVILTEMPDDR